MFTVRIVVVDVVVSLAFIGFTTLLSLQLSAWRVCKGIKHEHEQTHTHTHEPDKELEETKRHTKIAFWDMYRWKDERVWKFIIGLFVFPRFAMLAAHRTQLYMFVCRILCGLIASKCAIIISFCFHLMMLFIIWLSFFRRWKSAMTVASLSINLILPQLQHTITLWLLFVWFVGETASETKCN